GFTTRVNGRPVKANVEQRVVAGGVDRTALLRERGIPLAPFRESTNRALDRLPRAQWDELVSAGLAEIEEYDAGQGMQQHLSPRWALQTKFYWDQIFPARAETLIEHRYRPIVGGNVATMLGSPEAANEPWVAEYQRKYCMDQQFLAAIERARRESADPERFPFSEERIDYILETGANWAGPIKQFRLVVDKGAPQSLVSFCGEGVRKIGATQYEMRKSDFVPRGNVSVLIVKRTGGQ